MKVRTATRNDLETLKAFEQGIIAAERPYDHTLKPDPVSYYDIGELVDSDDAEVAVVDVDGQLIASGYARTKESKSYVQDTHHAYLGFMYVHPDYRGRGINKLLNAQLFYRAKDKGLPEVRLTACAGYSLAYNDP